MTIGQVNYEGIRASAPDEDEWAQWDQLAEWQKAYYEAGAKAVLENHEMHEKAYGRGMPA